MTKNKTMTEENNNNTSTGVKVGWTTDIHLNFCHIDKIKAWADKINENDMDCLVVTGDIAEGSNIDDYLTIMHTYIKCPIYFILGNHDYYDSNTKTVRVTMKKNWNTDKRCVWLGNVSYVDKGKIAIVGHDGWYDGLYANWYRSKVIMSDYHIIGDLKYHHDNLLHTKLGELATESAEHVRAGALKAIEDGFAHILIATHVPPFRENAVYQGVISDDNWMPHFSSKIFGDMLLDIGKNNPDVGFTVLCGHSHGDATYSPLSNLTCKTGYAKYRSPGLNNIFLFE